MIIRILFMTLVSPAPHEFFTPRRNNKKRHTQSNVDIGLPACVDRLMPSIAGSNTEIYF
jgi:hypothetical protein